MSGIDRVETESVGEEYYGKFYFIQNDDAFISDLKWYIGLNAEKNELTADSSSYERLNLYRTKENEMILQAMNGRYVSYQSGYYANETDRQNACRFTIHQVRSTNQVQLLHKDQEGIEYCVQRNEKRLIRQKWNPNNPEPGTLFMMERLSLGLEDLKRFGGNGDDLTYADVHGSDFTFASFSNAILDHANFSGCILKNATILLEDTSARDADFSQCDFTNAWMMRGDFSGSDFTKSNLANVDLSRSTLIGCCLDECHLKGGQYNDAVMHKCSMKEVEAEYCTFVNVDFSEAVLSNTDFKMSVFQENDFCGTVLDGVKMQGALFTTCKVDERTTFQGADLRQSTFEKMTLEHAAFRKADLSRCDLRGVNLSGCDLSYANLTQTLCSPKDDQAVLLVGATLANCNLTQADFTGAQLGTCGDTELGNAADLTNAIMVDAVFKGANLYGVNLAGVSWYGADANAENAQLQLANFSNANLSKFRLTNTSLNGCNFDYANLLETKFENAVIAPVSNLRKTSFSKANLQGAELKDCQIRQAVFTNAAIALYDGPYFSLPYCTKDYQQPTQNLNDIKKMLNKAGPVSDELYEVFKQAGYPLSKGMHIELVWENERWYIVNEGNKEYPRYNLYLGGDVVKVGGPAIGVPLFPIHHVTKDDLRVLNRYIDETKKKEKVQEMPKVIQDAFHENGYELVNQRINRNSIPDKKWLLDNQTLPRGVQEEKTKLLEGYIQFYMKAYKEKESAQYWIQVYGYTLASIRVNSEHEQEQQTTYYDATALIQNHLSLDTVCPDGQKCELLYDEKENVRIIWEQAMTASELPKPPKDIPIW